MKLFSFYKYTPIEFPERTRDHLFALFTGFSLRGKVYVASEGINVFVCGEEPSIEKLKRFVRNTPAFAGALLKEETVQNWAYRKLTVRVKQEIVHSGVDNVDFASGGKRLKPAELLEFYNSGKEFIIVDTRNDYESKIGHFKNALLPAMRNFREWDQVSDSLLEHKDTPIITYCTGGVRCEKASAVLVQKGFKEVYQIEGGILNFIQQYPDTVWQGGMFVFDDRKVVEPNTTPELQYTAECEFCGSPTAYYINCHNLDCDKIVVVCHECKTTHNYCCSAECNSAPRKRDRIYD